MNKIKLITMALWYSHSSNQTGIPSTDMNGLFSGFSATPFINMGIRFIFREMNIAYA